MPEWYFQIKARQDSKESYSQWIWPPVFSGKVTAETKKEARQKVDEEYQQSFPMRVLSKDIKSAHFLLNLHEIPQGESRTNSLFKVKNCAKCGGGFRVIDHYNNFHQRYVGGEFCSDECNTAYRNENNSRTFEESCATANTVIYKIQNVSSGKCYIGQTSKPFTLRWWQHFSHGTNTKFHQAIRESKITDWVFSVIEVVDFNQKPVELPKLTFILERELFWIRHFNSVGEGYNTLGSKENEDNNFTLFDGLEA